MSCKIHVSGSDKAFYTKDTNNITEISHGNIKVKIENSNLVMEYGSKTLEFSRKVPKKDQARACRFEEIQYLKNPDYSDGELYDLVLESIKNQ